MLAEGTRVAVILDGKVWACLVDDLNTQAPLPQWAYRASPAHKYAAWISSEDCPPELEGLTWARGWDKTPAEALQVVAALS